MIEEKNIKTALAVDLVLNYLFFKEKNVCTSWKSWYQGGWIPLFKVLVRLISKPCIEDNLKP